jgi:hypothetical protein
MRTIQLALNVLLNGLAEDLSLPPDFDDTADLVLQVRGRALVGSSGGFGDEGLVCAEELLLLAHLGRLGDFLPEGQLEAHSEGRALPCGLTIGEVDQDELLVGGRLLDALQPDIGNALGMAPVRRAC